MKKQIGIRREDKNIWERRVPLVPEHVKILKDEFGIESVVQPFERRAFPHYEYEEAGATIKEDMSDCPVILAVKEIPNTLLMNDKVYIYFSHTIKAQEYNMPMLKKLMDLKCTLIDYECITDDNGRRLVFFGKYAGLAGMIDTIHGMGKRYKALGFETPLEKIRSAYEYENVDEAKAHIAEVAEEIKEKGLPSEMMPVTVGFTGYGNVSKGAQEIFDLLPHVELKADELDQIDPAKNDFFHKVVFYEKDMVERIENPENFQLQEYFKKPELYRSKFEKYLKYLDVVINAIYWDENYPRFLRKEYLKENKDDIRLKVVGDITCDIDGSVEFTVKSTPSDNPAYVYNPDTEEIHDGYEGEGILNIAVDNLPAELPVNSSIEFSTSLYKFIPGILDADLSKDFSQVILPPEIKRAVIVYKGELTPEYKYLEEYLPK